MIRTRYDACTKCSAQQRLTFYSEDGQTVMVEVNGTVYRLRAGEDETGCPACEQDKWTEENS